MNTLAKATCFTYMSNILQYSIYLCSIVIYKYTSLEELIRTEEAKYLATTLYAANMSNILPNSMNQPK